MASDLDTWAAPLCRLPGKMPLWQQAGSLATCTPPPATSLSGLELWATDHALPLPWDIPPWKVGPSFKASLVARYQEGSNYIGLPGVLAATDGSVSQSGETMGAGVAFCPLGTDFPGMSNCFAGVGGDLSSLRSEAAALYLLLQETPPELALTVLMDSLGLLQTLQRWGRLDFAPKPEVQKHFDIILPILELLNQRTALTTLVKVKSHAGVPLNEAADALAELGNADPSLICSPEDTTHRLRPLTLEGDPIANLATHLRKHYSDSTKARLTALDGIMSRGFLEPCRGQKFLGKALKAMPSKEKRRLLRTLGGVFPCNHWLARINVVSSPDCPLCGKLDHFSHRVLTCGAVPDAITAAHNTVWAALFKTLCSHLDLTWTKIYDTVVNRTDIPCVEHSHLKPDGILSQESTKTLYVLEFKRTNDFFPDSFSRAFLRKLVKYKPLLESLRTSNPWWTVELFIFSLGDRGLLDEERWEANWDKMGLPENKLTPFCVQACSLAQTVATDILEVYSGAMQVLNAAPSGA